MPAKIHRIALNDQIKHRNEIHKKNQNNDKTHSVSSSVRPKTAMTKRSSEKIEIMKNQLKCPFLVVGLNVELIVCICIMVFFLFSGQILMRLREKYQRQKQTEQQ